MWWAWGPFVGLWLLQADQDLMNALNWSAKALLLMSFIVWVAACARPIAGDSHVPV